MCRARLQWTFGGHVELMSRPVGTKPPSSPILNTTPRRNAKAQGRRDAEAQWRSDAKQQRLTERCRYAETQRRREVEASRRGYGGAGFSCIEWRRSKAPGRQCYFSQKPSEGSRRVSEVSPMDIGESQKAVGGPRKAFGRHSECSRTAFRKQQGTR